MFAAELAFAIPKAEMIAKRLQDSPPIQRPRLVYKNDFVVEADIISWHASPEGYSLKGNVIATHGSSFISADQAELDQTKMEATFVQGVRIIDPVGEITATKVTVDFNGDPKNPSGWNVKEAVALDVRGKAHEAKFTADAITKTVDRIRVNKASFWLGELHVPDFKLSFRSVVVKPGDFVSSNKATLQLGSGIKIPLPFFRQSLKPGGSESYLPKISFNSQFEPRIAFRNLFQIGDRAGLSVNASARLNRVPLTSATLAYSFRDGRSGQLPALRIDNPDGERFMDGFFDNVMIASPEVEAAGLGKSKSLLFFGSSFNGGSSVRPGEPVRFDRDWYGGFDWGETFGGVSVSAQLRYGTITNRKLRDPAHRLEFFPAIISPSLRIGGSGWMRLRADSAIFGTSEEYGWVRGMLEAGADLHEFLSVGVGYAESFDWGEPMFDADRLYSEHALHLRADLKLPATKFSVLVKYDFDRRSAYDVEFTLKQAIRSIEPFVSYRSFPGTLSFGVSVRMQKLLEALQKRGG